ncbi:hypothetical protein HCU74_08405 [Spongiibacter sp. KMU-166]|uniref:Uncharacterized protein n=1 Tax=Spongiibacter thalassae TaxID=2721624 RepID=A0ABX1GG19_9GAMM|nr:hypothetical protein [Spongiibacter thalassae]NKI17437.1 hypothetical protein [Spongiibacter thalassae]
MRVTSADSETEYRMRGGSYVMAFKANGGTLDVQVRVEEGVFVSAKQYSEDFVEVADLGRAVCKFVVTGAGKLNVYGGINV